MNRFGIAQVDLRVLAGENLWRVYSCSQVFTSKYRSCKGWLRPLASQIFKKLAPGHVSGNWVGSCCVLAIPIPFALANLHTDHTRGDFFLRTSHALSHPIQCEHDIQCEQGKTHVEQRLGVTVLKASWSADDLCSAVQSHNCVCDPIQFSSTDSRQFKHQT